MVVSPMKSARGRSPSPSPMKSRRSPSPAKKMAGGTTGRPVSPKKSNSRPAAARSVFSEPNLTPIWTAVCSVKKPAFLAAFLSRSTSGRADGSPAAGASMKSRGLRSAKAGIKGVDQMWKRVQGRGWYLYVAPLCILCGVHQMVCGDQGVLPRSGSLKLADFYSGLSSSASSSALESSPLGPLASLLSTVVGEEAVASALLAMGLSYSTPTSSTLSSLSALPQTSFLETLKSGWATAIRFCCAAGEAELSLLTLRNLFFTVGTLFIVANTLVRLRFPCSYCPAQQARRGFLYGPLFARMLATVAEFFFYKLEADFLGLWFFTKDSEAGFGFQVGTLGFLTVLGEAICWLHIVFQSELLGWIEGCVWSVLQMSAFMLSVQEGGDSLDNLVSVSGLFRYGMILPYAAHMLVMHLPRMFRRVQRPFLRSYPWKQGPAVAFPDDDTLTWVTSSLVLKPVVFALMMLAYKTVEIPVGAENFAVYYSASYAVWEVAKVGTCVCLAVLCSAAVTALHEE